MQNFYRPLGPAAETAYAQVLDHVMMVNLQRSVADLSGTFAKKHVSGREYWYYQYRDVDQSVKQIYLGQRSERLDRLIEMKDSTLSGRRESIAKQARAAIALGNAGMTRAHFRVIRRLEEYGFFKAGGVLIETHAFACYGNMLGIGWGDSSHTQDVDFAYAGRSVSLALPTDVKLDVHDAISSLEMGFLPVSKLDGLVGGSYVIPHQPDFRLDFITTEGRDKSDLINFPNLNVAMVPLKFMEYSLEDIRQVAMLSEEGAILVNVPSPARYALHKLIVAGEREGSFQTKVHKDLKQAASLISFLAKYQPDDLMEAWTDLNGRGKGWRSRFAKGVEMMLRDLPEVEASLLWKAKASEQENTVALKARNPTS
jgi:hypothetical protein